MDTHVLDQLVYEGPPLDFTGRLPESVEINACQETGYFLERSLTL